MASIDQVLLIMVINSSGSCRHQVGHVSALAALLVVSLSRCVLWVTLAGNRRALSQDFNRKDGEKSAYTKMVRSENPQKSHIRRVRTHRFSPLVENDHLTVGGGDFGSWEVSRENQFLVLLIVVT